MPRTQKHASNVSLKAIIEEGCALLRAQESPNCMAVKKELDAKYNVNVSYGTLRNRFLGHHLSASDGHASQMLLSPEQESVLLEWIELLSDSAHPISKRTIRKKAEILSGHRPGQTWTRAFLRRHPEIKLGRPSGLDPKRSQAFNRNTVGHHFQLLKKYLDGLPAENVYNMDEKGCQRGGGRKTRQEKYFIPRNKRPKYKTRSDNLELVTIIECVSADGTALKPGFVFSGTQFSPEWFEEDPDIFIGTSENGWTNNHLCAQWFEKSFMPQAKARNTSGKKILLIYDGHGSHETIEMLRMARANGIILYSLPPHTTHKLQPLDVGVFGPFSRKWNDRCDDIIEETGQEMRREDFVKEYMAVRAVAFKETTIRSAWRKSGNYPLNPDVFQDDDYAPSRVTSYSDAHVPPSFPAFSVQMDFQSWSDDEPEKDSDDDDNDNEPSELPSASTLSTHVPPSTSSPPSSPPTPASSSTWSPSSLPAIMSLPLSNETYSFQSRVPHTPAPPSRYKKDEYTLSLEHERDALRSELLTVTAHCGMAVDQIRGLKRQIHEREKKGKKKRKLNVDGRCLTSSEGLALAEKENTAKEQEEARKEKEREAKEDKQKQRQEARETRNLTIDPFTGSLGGKTKGDLQDVAYALRLSLEGQKKEILTRINSHFDGNQELKADPRFSGMFSNSRTRRTTTTTTTEASVSQSATPPASGSHFPPLNPGNNFNSSSSFSAYNPVPFFSPSPHIIPSVHTALPVQNHPTPLLEPTANPAGDSYIPRLYTHASLQYFDHRNAPY